MEKIDANFRTLAKIGKGTKRKKRDINEIEVAEAMNSLYKKYNSLDKVARLVKLSPEMVRQIKSLSTLQAEVKKLYRAGVLRGYDIGYRISKLVENDQIILAKYVVAKDLSSGDVRAIVRYKIDNAKIPIEKAIKRVLQSKNINVYVAYLGIEKGTFEKLSEKIKHKERAKVLRSIFNEVVPPEFITHFELNGRVAIVKVAREGLQEMRSKAKELRVPLAKLADALVKGYLKGK